jgi:hypothetical protein
MFSLYRWAILGITDNLGAHSLRETFCNHQRVSYKMPIKILARHFNHESTKVKLRYLGIQGEEVNAILKNSFGKSPQRVI